MSGKEYKEGQEVLVFNVNRQRGKAGMPGRVIKVGRMLAYVLCEGWDDLRYVEKFDLETGRSQDGFSWIMTPEEVGNRERRELAIGEIRAMGLEFRPGWDKKYSMAELEDIAIHLTSFGPLS